MLKILILEADLSRRVYTFESLCVDQKISKVEHVKFECIYKHKTLTIQSANMA